MILHVPVKRRMNRGAFRGKLICPHLVKGEKGARICGANQWEYIENVNPTCIRYRCKSCGKTIRYDFSNNPTHPYATFGKNKWRRIVEAWKKGKGRD